MIQLWKERKSGTENELSALKFWESPKVKNAMFKAIEDRSDTRKQLGLAKNNIDNSNFNQSYANFSASKLQTFGGKIDKIEV